MSVLVYAFVTAVVAHEVAHWAAAHALGYPARIVLTWKGPGTMWGRDDIIVPHRHRLAVAAAGPAVNVVVAAVGWAGGMPWMAAMSLGVGMIQLVPVGPSDGTHMWRALRGVS